jgi:hypothetical protein
MRLASQFALALIGSVVAVAQSSSPPAAPAGLPPMSRFQLTPTELALRPLDLQRSTGSFASALPCRGLFVTSSASRFPSQKLDENILYRREFAPVLLPVVEELEQADVYAQVSPAEGRRAIEIRVTNRRTNVTTWQSIADDELIDDVVNALLERAVKVCPGGLAPWSSRRILRMVASPPHLAPEPSTAQVAAAWHDLLAARAELNGDERHRQITFSRSGEVISAADRHDIVLFSFTPTQLVDAQADSDWHTIFPELPMANMENAGNAGEGAGVVVMLCLGWDVAAAGVNLIRKQHHFVTVTWRGVGEHHGAIFDMHGGDAKRLVRALNTLRDAATSPTIAASAERASLP